jgi:hypothetical protein
MCDLAEAAFDQPVPAGTDDAAGRRAVVGPGGVTSVSFGRHEAGRSFFLAHCLFAELSSALLSVGGELSYTRQAVR